MQLGQHEKLDFNTDEIKLVESKLVYYIDAACIGLINDPDDADDTGNFDHEYDFNFDQLALYIDMLAGWGLDDGKFVCVIDLPDSDASIERPKSDTS